MQLVATSERQMVASRAARSADQMGNAKVEMRDVEMVDLWAC